LLKLPTLSHRTQKTSPPAFSPKDSSMSLPLEPATLAAGRPQQHNGPVALVQRNTTGPWPSVGGDERGRHTVTQPPVRRHTGRRGGRPSACKWSASKRLRVVGVQATAGGRRPSACGLWASKRLRVAGSRARRRTWHQGIRAPPAASDANAGAGADAGAGLEAAGDIHGDRVWGHSRRPGRGPLRTYTARRRGRERQCRSG